MYTCQNASLLEISCRGLQYFNYLGYIQIFCHVCFYFQAASAESDMALALNRYLCGSVLPLLTNHSHYFEEADHVSSLLESTLNTVYRLSKCNSLTKVQREMVSGFLVAFTKYVEYLQ